MKCNVRPCKYVVIRNWDVQFNNNYGAQQTEDSSINLAGKNLEISPESQTDLLSSDALVFGCRFYRIMFNQNLFEFSGQEFRNSRAPIAQNNGQISIFELFTSWFHQSRPLARLSILCREIVMLHWIQTDNGMVQWRSIEQHCNEERCIRKIVRRARSSVKRRFGISFSAETKHFLSFKLSIRHMVGGGRSGESAMANRKRRAKEKSLKPKNWI